MLCWCKILYAWHTTLITCTWDIDEIYDISCWTETATFNVALKIDTFNIKCDDILWYSTSVHIWYSILYHVSYIACHDMLYYMAIQVYSFTRTHSRLTCYIAHRQESRWGKWSGLWNCIGAWASDPRCWPWVTCFNSFCWNLAFQVIRPLSWCLLWSKWLGWVPIVGTCHKFNWSQVPTVSVG